jgi:DNA-binding transcriptional MerR regulator
MDDGQVMFSIGDFARFAGVSVRTVRYYDEVGLLPPVAVDPGSGYRSYTADQLARLHRIIALKDLGLSLRQIRPLLDDLDAAELRGMLQLKRAELEDRLAEERERLTRVERRLLAIEKESELPPEVILKTIPELRIAAVRCTQPAADFDEVPQTIEPAVLRLIGAITHGEVKPTGPMIVYYEAGPDGSLEPVAAVPIGTGPLPADGPVTEVVLPPVEVAAAVHEGLPDHVEGGRVSTLLPLWAQDHGYRAAGRGRDLILAMPDHDGRGVFEHQLPLEQAGVASPPAG